MKTKTCSKCKKEQRVTEFYEHKRDGLQSRCKDCSRVDNRIRNQTPARREYNKKHYLRLKQEGYFREYAQRPEVKKRLAAYQREYQKNPIVALKHKVQRLTRTYKDAGKLTQQPCFVCGKTDTEAHHPDYTKPFDVIWFCPQCHTNEHIRLRKDKP